MQIQRLAASGIPAPITPGMEGGKKLGWNGKPPGVSPVILSCNPQDPNTTYKNLSGIGKPSSSSK